MGVKRYELSEAQWARIAPMLPGKVGDSGRSGVDNRLFVNGVLWVLRSGAHWQHLPERYGKWKSVHARFTRWAKAGVWEKVFAELIKDRDNKYLMLDTTLVRVIGFIGVMLAAGNAVGGYVVTERLAIKELDGPHSGNRTARTRRAENYEK